MSTSLTLNHTVSHLEPRQTCTSICLPTLSQPAQPHAVEPLNNLRCHTPTLLSLTHPSHAYRHHTNLPCNMTTQIHKPTCLAPAHSITHLTASLKLPCYAPFSAQPALSHNYPSCPIPLSDSHTACLNRPHTCVPISYGLIPPHTYPTQPTYPATDLPTVPQPAWHMPNYLTISHPAICLTALHQPA